MPSKRQAAEWLANEVAKGRGEDKCHIVDVTSDQQKRIKNERRKTKFVLNTDDPDLCARLEFHKDRIFRRCKDKSKMLWFMEKAWAEALSDSEIDRVLAIEEGPETL